MTDEEYDREDGDLSEIDDSVFYDDDDELFFAELDEDEDDWSDAVDGVDY